MTLQRLTREDAAPRPTLRAKPLSHDRLRSVSCATRVLDRGRPVTTFRPRGIYESLLGEISRVLSSSLDYKTALREVTRVVADRLDCGCVADLLEPGSTVQIAHLSDRVEPATSEALAPLVADVVSRRRLAAAALDESTLDGRRARAVAERARQGTGSPWLVCAPIATEGGEAFGALTLFGGTAGGYVPQELVRDIAQRAAVAIQNGRLYQAAIVAAQERQRVLSLVAHELKNPLGVILMGAVQALDGVHTEPPVSGRRELEAIYRSAKRMKKLVGDLLDLASIDAGKLSIKPTACDVTAVIGSAISDIAPNAQAAGIELLDDRLPGLSGAWVDGDRLGQVLVNLMSNAIKFTPRGGRVRVRCAPVDKTEIVIAVEDSGRGIPPGDLDRIFDHFWQASDTAQLGSGLGLAICKSIVELSGGRIWAQSTLGVGTTVYFTLPTTAR
jgi:signal transduction histidine kinase